MLATLLIRGVRKELAATADPAESARAGGVPLFFGGDWDCSNRSRDIFAVGVGSRSVGVPCGGLRGVVAVPLCGQRGVVKPSVK
mmetsp:Transcript_66078/g.167481  ORF Transcript_66078/g.167481 Transcript_66078/m.167481 type:complete len:84 (+) Transcript_66078:755-1006(+)